MISLSPKFHMPRRKIWAMLKKRENPCQGHERKKMDKCPNE
jgi:hypothetical protein